MDDTNATMSPDASPSTPSAKSGVRRVNNMPMYMIGGVMLAFLVIMVLVAASRASQQNEPKDEGKEQSGDASQFAKAIAGNQRDGMIPADTPKPPDVPPLPSFNGVTIVKPENPDAPPLPNPGTFQPATPPIPSAPPVVDRDAERIRLAKLQQLEEAARARTTVQTGVARSSGSQGIGGNSREATIARVAALRQQADAIAGDDVTEAYKARLAQIQKAGLIPGVGSAEAQTTQPSGSLGLLQTAQSSPTGKRGDRWKLDSTIEAPRSPFELRAGFVIPATLISGINSELPGQIMAQVSQSVYDTATGKHELVPQGSRLLGTYSSEVAYGQSRVLVNWQRIIFPDGKALDIGSMPGADSAGYSGFKDQVNNHYFRLFGSAILLSGVTAGISYSQKQNQTGNDTTQSAGDVMSQALGQQLGQVTAQLISKNMNVAPTLEIRPGYRFNVIVVKDLTFTKPYKPFDY